jgi:hypothetical protein
MEANEHYMGYFTHFSVRLHTVMEATLKNKKMYSNCEKTSGTFQRKITIMETEVSP